MSERRSSRVPKPSYRADFYRPTQEHKSFPFLYEDCVPQALANIVDNPKLNMAGAGTGNEICKYARVLMESKDADIPRFTGFQVTEEAANQNSPCAGRGSMQETP